MLTSDLVLMIHSSTLFIAFDGIRWFGPRADCDAPCFEQLKATHLRASPKQQALLDVLLQLIKTWPFTIGPWFGLEFLIS